MFWSTYENYEHPAYGPFTIEARSVFVSLDVDNLVYAEGGKADIGAIPKGYYDFVYTDTDNGKTFRGIISLRLSATNPDGLVSPDNRPVAGSSSGGCDSGMSLAGLGVLILVCLMRRK